LLDDRACGDCDINLAMPWLLQTAAEPRRRIADCRLLIADLGDCGLSIEIADCRLRLAIVD